MESSSVYQRIHNYWIETGVELLPPEDESDIVKVFGRNGRHPVSHDIIRLYGVIGGFPERSIDDNLFSLWPLSLVSKENADNQGPDVLFSDYLICSHCFSIRYVTADKSEVLSAELGHWANSLEEFLESYLSDPQTTAAGFLDH